MKLLGRLALSLFFGLTTPLVLLAMMQGANEALFVPPIRYPFMKAYLLLAAISTVFGFFKVANRPYQR
jgi:hypothetical protein